MRWILAVLFLAGCGTTGALRQEPLDSGAQRLFRYPVSQVTEACKRALKSEGFDVREVAEVQDSVWSIMAVKGMSLMSYGELARITLAAEGPERTVARFITKKRLATNVAAKGDWSASIYEQMEGILSGRIVIEEENRAVRRRGPR